MDAPHTEHRPLRRAFPWLWGSLLCIGALPAQAIVALPAQAQDFAERPLEGAPAVLRGRHAAFETMVSIPPAEARNGLVQLELELSASAVLRDVSMLTVSLDGIPLRTLRVSALGEMGDALTLDLPADGGFHRLEVRAALYVGEDRCREDHPHEAWLRVGARSRLLWMTRAGDTAHTPLSVRRGWSDPVFVEGAPHATPDDTLVYLEAVGMLRSHDIETRSAEGSARLSLSVRETPFEDTTVTARLSVAADDALRLTATSHEALAHALVRLRDDDVWRACGRDCTFGNFALAPAGEEPFDTPNAVALRLRDVGFAEGWVARGEGQHVLRFGWAKPAHWTLTEWPTLDIPIRVSNAVSAERSQVSVSIGGRPISSWDLETEDGAGRLAVRIPADLWSSPRWDIEVRAHLAAEDADDCTAEREDLWLSASGDTELRVPREQPRYDGLASLADGPPTLQLAEGLEVAEAHALALVLHGMRPDANRPLPRVQGDPPCAAPCVRVEAVRVGDRAGGLRVVRHEGSAGWWSPEGTLSRPVQPATGPLLTVTCDGGECGQLTVWLPPSPADALQPPPLADLLGRQAVWEGERWTDFDFATSPASTDRVELPSAPSPGAESRVSSLEERATQLFDTSWSLALVLLLMGGSLWIWRSRTPKGDQLP